MEASLHSVETELESVRVQLEEESEARLDLERQLVKANGEVSIWRSKFETEANARIEEVEEIRRKYSCRIQEQEEQIENLLVKINNLEKQKSRLQSEVEVLIIDLEKVNFIKSFTIFLILIKSDILISFFFLTQGQWNSPGTAETRGAPGEGQHRA